MKTTHAYVAPAIGSTQSKVSMEAWEQSLERYNEGKHLEAFHLLLDHLNPGFRAKYGNADGTEFHIPHGAILVISSSATDGWRSMPISSVSPKRAAWPCCARSPT